MIARTGLSIRCVAIGVGVVAFGLAVPAAGSGQPSTAEAVHWREPQWPPKTSRTLLSDEAILRARNLCRVDKNARAVLERIVNRARPWLSVTDEQIRLMLPDGRVPRAVNVSVEGCPVHGKAVFRFGTYPWKHDPSSPYSLICPVGGERYPSNDFEAFYRGGMNDRSLLTGPYPDDGRGWVSPSGEKYWFVAHACHNAWEKAWLPAVNSLSQAYVLTGDRRYAQKAAAFLDRIAEVYPGMDYHSQSRYGEYRETRKGPAYHGKILNKIWETRTLRELAAAYDGIFDTLTGRNSIELKWRSAADIRTNIEANLLEEGIAAVQARKIVGNFGAHQRALMYAAVVRQNGPIQQLLDDLFSETGGEPANEGLKYALYNLVYKDGTPNESSPYYSSGWVNNLLQIVAPLKLASIDLFQNSKLLLMPQAPLRLLCLGEFTPNIGDSGGLGRGWVTPSAETYDQAYRATGNGAYAWAAKQLGGFQKSYSAYEDLFEVPVDSRQLKLDIGSYQHLPVSRFLDGFGAAILNNRADTTAVAMFYGIRNWHGHFDRLNIEVFGGKRRLSPDLGYPDDMSPLVSGIYSWSQNTVSHNCMIVDDQRQVGQAAGQVLRFHDSPTVDVVDITAPGTYPQADVYRRTLVMVETGEHDSYIVDVFRVRGGKTHTLSIHGGEADFQFNGWDLPPAITEGTLAGRDVQYGQLYDDPVMGAPGYKGAFERYKGSGYSHLFNWQRIVPDRPVAASWIYSQPPAACMNVHVLPCPGQEITLADAYVSPLKKTTKLKYMLLNRPAVSGGNTFITVWELARGKPFIDQVHLQADPSLGTGCDQVAAVSVHRGQAVDVVTVAPDAGRTYSIGETVSSDAAVTVITIENGRAARVFAAGGSELSGGRPSQTVPIPASVTGTITSADYGSKTIVIEPQAPAEPEGLAGRYIRISNPSHSCVYQIASAEIADGKLRVQLSGSDVFTGRVRVDRVDPQQGTVTTPTKVPFDWRLKGMHLVSEDLTGSRAIADIKNGVISVGAAGLTGSFAAGQDAWIADFGPGDSVEIENSVYRQAK